MAASNSNSRQDDRLRAPVTLSPDYLEAVRTVEQAAMNQDGADKSWAYRALEQSRRYFAAVQRG